MWHKLVFDDSILMVSWRGRGSSHWVVGIVSPTGITSVLSGVPSGRTGVLRQPGSDADLQYFVTGLEDGQVPEALVELHLPRAPCAPGTPVLLFQLEFKRIAKFQR